MDEPTQDWLTGLFTEPWVSGGLDQKERVYLITTAASDLVRLYDPNAIETKVIELALAGAVNPWLVGHDQFNAQSILATMKQAERGS